MATYGKTDIGDSETTAPSDYIFGTRFTMPEDGLITAVDAYIRSYSGDTRSVSLGIYSVTSNDPVNLLASYEIENIFSETWQWWEFTFSYEGSANTEYHFQICASNGFMAKYDADVSEKSAFKSGVGYSLPNPYPANPNHNNYILSIFATYTPAGVEGQPYSSRVQRVTGMRRWGGISSIAKRFPKLKSRRFPSFYPRQVI